MNLDPTGMTAIVSEKGQVTIPKKLRDSLGLKMGQVLEFSERNGSLLARKVVRDDPITAVRGIIELPAGTDAFMDEIRGAPDLP